MRLAVAWQVKESGHRYRISDPVENVSLDLSIVRLGTAEQIARLLNRNELDALAEAEVILARKRTSEGM